MVCSTAAWAKPLHGDLVWRIFGIVCNRCAFQPAPRHEASWIQKPINFSSFFKKRGGGETFFEMAAVVPAMGAKSVGKRAAWKSNEAQLRKERARESD